MILSKAKNKQGNRISFLLASFLLMFLFGINNISYGEESTNPTVLSIERQTPTDLTTNADEVIFRVTFSDAVARVSVDDFVLNGTIAGDATIASVTRISDSVFDVKVTGITTSEGTLGLDIEGVDGAGSNDIIKLVSTLDANESGTYNQTSGDATKIGQSFEALNTGLLHSISLNRYSGFHSYSGTATIKIFAGQTVSGVALATQEINVTNGSGFETYVFADPPSVTDGDTYTWSWEKGSGSGSANYMGTTSNPYSDGVAYVSTLGGFSSSVDFVFQTQVITDTTQSLSTTQPVNDETYTITNPPVASNVTISGNFEVGEELAGSYNYSDPQSDSESGSTFKWYRSDDSNGFNKTEIIGAVTTTYTATEADESKFISFEVTPSDGVNTGNAIESSLIGPVEPLLKIVSISRQYPSGTQAMANDSVTFRVVFNEGAFRVTKDDFFADSTAGGSVSSVKKIDNKTYDVSISGMNTSGGVAKLNIKGVAGNDGSNDIAKPIYSNGSATISQTDTNDYLNQEKIGQTFEATSNNFLTAFTVYPKDGQHSFTGTVDLKIFSGDESTGGATLLTSQSITMTNSTAVSGQSFNIESPPALTSGNTYSIIMENFSGSGSQALNSSTGGNYANGHVIFTGYNSGSHSAFDLKFDIFEGSQTAGSALQSNAPFLEETFTILPLVPTTVTSIVRQTPTDSTTNADEITFRVTFSDDVARVSVDDFALSGSVSGDGNIASVTVISDSLYDVKITGLTNSEGTLGLDIKGVDGSGSNNIIKLVSEQDAQQPGNGLVYTVNESHIAQSFEALNTGLVHSISINRNTLLHTYSGTATIKIFSGATFSSTPLIAQEINVTDGSGFEEYILSVPASVSEGNTYTWSLEKGTGSGNIGYTLMDSNPYSDGEAYASNFSDSFLSDFDFNFQIQVVTDTTQTLATTFPGIDETYTIINPPVASNVLVSGILETGQQLVGTYNYNDPQSDSENGTTFKWYRSDDSEGTNKIAITEATDTLYTITSADVKKYLSFEVTPSDGNNIGEPVESTRHFVDGPPELLSITRLDPEDETTKLNEVTFRAAFDKGVTNVDSSDFVQTGSVSGILSSVAQISDTTYDITISELPNSSGTVGIAIKGVGEQGGTNDIAGFEFINGSATITQTSVNDYLNQTKLGQSFQATTNNFFTAFTIFPEDGQHSFSGTADLEIYSGNEDDGGATLLTSQTINITNNTDASGQTFSIESAPQLTSGKTYSFILKNWSGSGTYAFSSSTNGNYADGRAIFTGNNSGHLNFDLRFEVFEGTKEIGTSLASTAPTTNEIYTKQANEAPVVSNVLISGTTNVGDTLFASYIFTDSDGDQESGSSYKWYASDDESGTNKSEISDANDTLFVIQLSSNGKFLSFEVTPSDGVTEGISVESNRVEVEEFFGGGAGTSGDPYQISNPTHLNNMRVDLNAHYQLINDIDMDVAPYNSGSGWEPVGNSSSTFQGTLDGNNFKIANLFINYPTKDTVGFFSDLNGTAKNIRFENADVTGRDLTGIIAGRFYGFLDKTSVSGSVSGRNKVGSFFGIMREGTSADKSFSEATVTATGDRVGGLTGVLETAYLTDAYFSGSVSTVGDKVGGIVGEGYETITSGGLTRVYGSGSVSGANQVGAIGGDVSGTQYRDVFWDTQTTGTGSAVGSGSDSGISGKTTTEMRQDTTFTNFDFSSVWVIDAGVDYPKLLERQENNLIITGNEGWRMLSTPVSSTSFGTLLDGLWTQGFTGADFTGGSSNVYEWSESSKAFESVSNATDVPGTGKGFITYVFRDDNGPDVTGDAGFPKVLTNSGSQFTGAANPEVTFTNSGTLADDGWNLLGNPYGTSINWGASNGWSRTNLDGTFYVWSDSASNGAGAYLSWNGTTGTLENGKIASWQGFWVKANAAGPSFSMNDSVKSTGGTLFKEKSVPQIKFSLTGNEMISQTIVMFDNAAHQEKDALDAYKLNSLSNEYLLLGTSIGDLESMDIQALPLDGSQFLLDLDINGSSLNGDFTLSWDKTSIPSDWEIKLIDREEETETRITTNSSVGFKLNSIAKSKDSKKLRSPVSPVQVLSKSKEKTSRFAVLIRQSVSVSNEPKSDLPKVVELQQNYPNPFNPSTTITYGVPESGAVTLEIFDLLGRRVATLLNSERKNAGRYTVDFNATNLASGMYLYRLKAGNTVLIKKLTLIK